MAKIHIVWDPNETIVMDPNAEKQFGHKVALLSVPNDLKTMDIYHLAKRLAELLLERLP